jgi:hypothetical protein
MSVVAYPSTPLPYAARQVLAALASHTEEPVVIGMQELATEAELAISADALRGLARLADAGQVRYVNNDGELIIWRL